MSDNKKENLFAKLAVLDSKTTHDAAEADRGGPAVAAVPKSHHSPAPAETPKPKISDGKKKPEPITGKRANPDYCQANAYVPKSVRRAVDKALLDIDDLDYSTLITDLLRKWLKSRGVSD